MQHKNLLDVLARGGLGKDGDAFVTPSGLSVTVYLDLGQEALIVDRVARVEVGAEVTIVPTRPPSSMMPPRQRTHGKPRE